MYITTSFTRIVCTECKKEVQRIRPSIPFEKLEVCECQKNKEVEVAKPRKNTKKV